MTARPRAANDAGFTLTELLVVVALLGLLSLVLAPNLRVALEAWPRIATMNAEGEKLDSVRLRLANLLSQARPLLVEDAGQGTVRFDGAADQIGFLAPLAERFGPADIVKFILRADDDRALRLAWALDRDPASEMNPVETAAWQPTEMLTGVTQASFQYFGCSQDGGKPQWWDRWARRSTLPVLIRLQFSWRGRNETLVVAPRIEGESSFSEIHEASCSE